MILMTASIVKSPTKEELKAFCTSTSSSEIIKWWQASTIVLTRMARRMKISKHRCSVTLMQILLNQCYSSKFSFLIGFFVKVLRMTRRKFL